MGYSRCTKINKISKKKVKNVMPQGASGPRDAEARISRFMVW